MGKTENEEKKKFLWSYRDSVRRLERISAEIEEIRAMKMGVSAGTGGTGRKGWKTDLSAYAAQLDGLERRLEEERKTRISVYNAVRGTIGDLKDEREHDALFYRYIKGLPFWKVGEKLGCSETWAHIIHGRALEKLKIPEEFMEVKIDM